MKGQSVINLSSDHQNDNSDAFKSTGPEESFQIESVDDKIEVVEENKGEKIISSTTNRVKIVESNVVGPRMSISKKIS